MRDQNKNRRQREFALMDSPDAYVISVHMRNMMATYGEERVKDIVWELFIKNSKQKRRREAVGE